MEEENKQNFCCFQLGVETSTVVPSNIIVEFQQTEHINVQTLCSDSFHRPYVSGAQCNMGMEQYPNAGIHLNSEDEFHPQGCGQNIECIEHITKDAILQLHRPYPNFRSKSARDVSTEVEDKLPVFDLSDQKD